MPTFRGKPACDCLARWLPAYEAELQARGLLTGPLHIYQLIGGAAASAGTHSTGGAFDLTDLPGDRDLWVARQMGADATWSRLTMDPPHVHGVLRGCPHNAPARYQIDAVDDGYNGLGTGGRGGPDDGPRPLMGRTWQQGIAWHNANVKARRKAARDKTLRKALKAAQVAARKAGRLSMRDRLKKMRLRIKP